MLNRALRRVLLLALVGSILSGAIHAQVLSFPRGDSMQAMTAVDAIQNGALNFNLFTINSQNADGSPLQGLTGAVSKFDLKAPEKAKRAYDKGYQLLQRKDLPGAVEQLTKAITIYPNYVAAHNALGTAYLEQNQNETARSEFAKSAALDDHLPNSFLNLGIAQLALKDNASAEESFRKASSLAPLDLQLSMALAYGEFVNQDYPAVLETARDVHARKHKNAAVVHYFAAAAYEAESNLANAQDEMETLLREDPKSPSVPQFSDILAKMKTEQAQIADRKLHPVEPAKVEFKYNTAAELADDTGRAQKILQDVKEKTQIAEAEATSDIACPNCAAAAADMPVVSRAKPVANSTSVAGIRFKSKSDEVAVFFSATDHGKSVTDLTASDVQLRDDNRPPHAILGFRNEAELPLRLAVVVDTSESITKRFKFEQAAAAKFMQAMLTQPSDLAFLLEVNNSVLVVQDFTSDQAQMSRAINQLAPGGGTALWDAVSYAAEKLVKRRETQPVSRVVVVISDGEDNSSSTTLKEAIARAQHGEVAIYTVSTRDDLLEGGSELGDHALETLAGLSGGAAFRPGSVGHFGKSLGDLQQVLRGRYFVSYKPASFERDGRYRTIEITAAKDGHPIKVYARKGYYALPPEPPSGEQ